MRIIITYHIGKFLWRLALECCSLLVCVLLTSLVQTLVISLRILGWINLSNCILVSLTSLLKTTSLLILRFLEILWRKCSYVLRNLLWEVKAIWCIWIEIVKSKVLGTFSWMWWLLLLLLERYRRLRSNALFLYLFFKSLESNQFSRTLLRSARYVVILIVHWVIGPIIILILKAVISTYLELYLVPAKMMLAWSNFILFSLILKSLSATSSNPLWQLLLLLDLSLG